VISGSERLVGGSEGGGVIVGGRGVGGGVGAVATVRAACAFTHVLNTRLHTWGGRVVRVNRVSKVSRVRK
jgi:tRNA(Ile2) C34 agmatinyltransferase TiaS